MPSYWIPYKLVGKNGADKISALFFFFFWKKYVTGIIALQIKYATMMENTTEKITLCGQTRNTQRNNYGKTSATTEK